MKKKDYILTSIIVIAIITLAIACGGYFISASTKTNTFAKGTVFGGVDISGLDIDSAGEKVNGALDRLAENARLTLGRYI